MEVSVKSVTQEAPRIRSFTVCRPAGVNPTPGQFFMLSRARVGEVPISVRSITPSELGFTVRRVGAVTAALTSLEVGDTVGVRGPFGRGFVVAGSGEGRGQDDGASNLVLIAGGLGIVPLQPLIQAWPQSKKKQSKEGPYQAVQCDAGPRLVYGARSPEELLFLSALAPWERCGRAVITVDSATSSWRGRIGTVVKYLSGAVPAPAATTAYLCGPEVMMRLAAHHLEELGVPVRNIFLSLERNMECATGICGRCQFGPLLLCRDGPVVAWAQVRRLMQVREL